MHEPIILPQPEIQKILVNMSLELGLDLYVVGGTVRDAYLGRMAHDLDYVVSASSDRLAQQVARRLGGKAACLDATFGVMRIVLHSGEHLDLVNRQGESIEDDLSRRDCSLNAIALALVENGEAITPPRLVDPTGGLEDLRNRTIRALSVANLLADPVRMLRLLRIAATHRFRLELETLEWIEEHSRWLSEAPGERVAAEWMQILDRSDACLWVNRIIGLNLMENLIPELMALKTLVRGPDKLPWILVETLERLERFDSGLERFRELHPEAGQRLLKVLASPLPGQVSLAATLRLGLLLQDVGKPYVRMVAADGSTGFGDHAAEGVVRASRALERLKLASRARELVLALIRNPQDLEPWKRSPSSPVARFRLFQALGKATPGYLLSCPAPDWPDSFDTLLAWLDPAEKLTRPVRLLTGDVARAELDIKPGPALGHLLECALEAQLLDEFQDVTGAIAWARRHGDRLDP